MASIKSKSVSQNHLQLRRMCNHFYSENITDPVVEQLLNFLIFNPFSRAIKEHIFFDLEEVNGIQKGKEKEMGLEGCAISLIEGLLERFTHFTHGLIANLVINSINCNYLFIKATGKILIKLRQETYLVLSLCYLLLAKKMKFTTFKVFPSQKSFNSFAIIAITN